MGHHTGDVGDQITPLPLLPVLLVFRSFSERVALYVVVVLVCPWEEVSSSSSYSAILIPPFFEDFIILFVNYLVTLLFLLFSFVDYFWFQPKGSQ